VGFFERFLLLISIFVLVICSTIVFGRNSHPTSYEQVVKIVADGNFLCTGVVVKKNVVATAGHCLTRHRKVGVKILNRPMKVFTRWKYRFSPYTHEDWGFLIGDTGNIKPWKLKAGPPKTPYPTTFISADPPEGKQQRAIPIVIDKYFYHKGILNLIGQGVVIGGDSGSPILDHEKNVIGLIVATNSNYGFWGTPAEYLIKNLP
jgi:hypothetical protein